MNEYPLTENELDAAMVSAETAEASKFTEAVSLSELLKTEYPQARFVVDRLFEMKSINMLSAPPNKWKSWIVILCALCVASGKPLFCKFATQQMKVLIVNEEDTERLLQERCQMLMEETDELPVYFHIGKQIKLTEEFVDALIEESTRLEVGLVIFDSLRSVHDADENSSQEMQKIMDQLKRMTRSGLTVLFTHHNRKKARGGGKDEAGEESRGSSAINAALHGHLSCDESDHDGKKYLVIYQQKLKADAKIAPFEVAIEQDGPAHKMRFLYEGIFNDRVERTRRVKDVFAKVFDESTKWLAVKDLVEMGLGANTMVRGALALLLEGGLIQARDRKEVMNAGLPVASVNGSHNERLYFRSDLAEAMKEPIETNQLDL